MVGCESRVRGALSLQLLVPVGGEEGGESLKGSAGKNMREELDQTQAGCFDLKGKKEILTARLERRVDVCNLRRLQQHCDYGVTVRTSVW